MIACFESKRYNFSEGYHLLSQTIRREQISFIFDYFGEYCLTTFVHFHENGVGMLIYSYLFFLQAHNIFEYFMYIFPAKKIFAGKTFIFIPKKAFAFQKKAIFGKIKKRLDKNAFLLYHVIMK